jgi:hypothetical protein
MNGQFTSLSSYNKSLIRYTAGINIILLLVCIVVLITALLISYPMTIHSIRYLFLSILLLLNLLLLRKGKFLLGKVLTLIGPFLFIFLLPVLSSHLHVGMFLWFPYGLIMIGSASFLVFSWRDEKILLHSFFFFFVLCSLFFDHLMIPNADLHPSTSFIFEENHIYYILSKILLSVFMYCALYLFKYTAYKHSLELEQLHITLSYLNTNLEAIVKERTIQLETQNRKIRELTYANSHKVRACVARITGLIQLTDIHPSPHERDLYYRKIKETAKISYLLSDDHHT